LVLTENVPKFVRLALKMMYSTLGSQAVQSGVVQRLLQHMSAQQGRNMDSRASAKEIRVSGAAYLCAVVVPVSVAVPVAVPVAVAVAAPVRVSVAVTPLSLTPVSMDRWVQSFIRTHNLNTAELLEPLANFRTFNEFFYRKLKPGARVIAEPGNDSVCMALWT
jgi:hypothetical protein